MEGYKVVIRNFLMVEFLFLSLVFFYQGKWFFKFVFDAFFFFYGCEFVGVRSVVDFYISFSFSRVLKVGYLSIDMFFFWFGGFFALRVLSIFILCCIVADVVGILFRCFFFAYQLVFRSCEGWQIIRQSFSFFRRIDFGQGGYVFFKIKVNVGWILRREQQIGRLVFVLRLF